MMNFKSFIVVLKEFEFVIFDFVKFDCFQQFYVGFQVFYVFQVVIGCFFNLMDEVDVIVVLEFVKQFVVGEGFEIDINEKFLKELSY